MRSLFCFLLVCPFFAGAQEVRLKDLVTFEGVRSNELVGYGLVVGLNGTGDSLRNAPFTEDTLANTLERLGVNIIGEQIRSKNVASVIITAQLPPFARVGNQISADISTIGDATSLEGGTLVLAPLSAADGQVYAVAQGNVIVNGLVTQAEASRLTQGNPTSGQVPQGVTVEAEIDYELNSAEALQISLRTPDFSTASQVEKAINDKFKIEIARQLDARTIDIDLTQLFNVTPSKFISQIEAISIKPDMPATIAIDLSSETIIISEHVRIERVAISKGGLTIQVTERPIVVQPNPFSEGQPIIVPRSSIRLEGNESVNLAELRQGTNLSDLVMGLNSLGLNAGDLVEIFKSLKMAGALHAELIIR